MGIKLIKTDYKDGVSTAIVSSRGREYVGTAKLSPEDMDAGYESKFLGPEIAHARAIKKALKADKQILNIQRKEMNDFYNSIKESNVFKNYEEYSSVGGKLRRRIIELDHKIAAICDEINEIGMFIEERPTEHMKRRDRVLELKKLDRKHYKY